MKEDEKATFYLNTIYVYKDDIYRIMRNVVNDHYIAEDLTQTVMVKAWYGINSLKDPKSAKPWVKRIAENTIRDYIRNKTIHVPQGDRDLIASFVSLEELTDIEKDLEYALVVREDVERVFYALRTLAPKYQDIIRLHLIGNVSLKDIAESSKMNYGTVRVMYSRGMRYLREAYWEMEKGGVVNG